MTEVLLIRHAQARVNAEKNGDDPAFGSRESPLTERGIKQILGLGGLRQQLIEVHGIIPEEYEPTVLCSQYRRTFETALTVGFRHIYRSSIVDESEIYSNGPLKGVDIVKKHVVENGWIPEEELMQARDYIEAVRRGSLPQRIVFAHGMVIAGIQSVLSLEGASIPFVPRRGFIPWQASITAVDI